MTMITLVQWIAFAGFRGAPDAVRLANDLGYYCFVVTNQAGVARAAIMMNLQLDRCTAWDR